MELEKERELWQNFRPMDDNIKNIEIALASDTEEIFLVKYSALYRSGLLRGQVKDLSSGPNADPKHLDPDELFLFAEETYDEPIETNLVTIVLQRIAFYLNAHNNEEANEPAEIFDRRSEIVDLDRDLIASMTIDELYEILEAANFLEILSILDMGINYIGDRIKEIPYEEIRKILPTLIGQYYYYLN